MSILPRPVDERQSQDQSRDLPDDDARRRAQALESQRRSRETV